MSFDIKSAVASATVDALASTCGRIVSSGAFKVMDEDTSSSQVQGAMASAVLAGVIRFCTKTFAIAGFSKEELIEAIGISYDVSLEDEDVKTANKFRKAKNSMGSSYKETMQ